MDERFAGMHPVHTNNNAALTILGLGIGRDNFDAVIGQTVAMGMDNDCTTATAGSLFGAVYGIEAIPEKWYRRFNNTVHCYMNGQERFRIDDVLARFSRLARINF